ncbi:hypothetical protein [Pseudomonas sp. UMAB-08]|uniref:hypothetical protein n=1 Tax=Pseudomonas sp. UMAB-08 TaxID=1365375 RepID=UPI001C5A4E5B|nr:hypothetical protein [Pseudomonas sp. UMAB-08]
MITYGLFPLLTFIFYLPTLWAVHAFSDMKFSKEKLILVVFYIYIFVYIHLPFSTTGVLPFVGKLDNSIIGRLSFFMKYAHAASFPVPDVRRKWFLRRVRPPMRVDIPPG